ncbi:hypothetical protein OKW33_003779 [Paraburkholderia atlantica]
MIIGTDWASVIRPADTKPTHQHRRDGRRVQQRGHDGTRQHAAKPVRGQHADQRLQLRSRDRLKPAGQELQPEKKQREAADQQPEDPKDVQLVGIDVSKIISHPMCL